MVLFYESRVLNANEPVIIYAGKDKVESESLTPAMIAHETLIRYAYPQDVWYHVDKLSSPHIYLRMPQGMSWEAIPEALSIDCGQLVKAGSIQGNKKDNVTIIYTPASNLKKTGDMAVGQVSFHKDKMVKRIHIPTRDNAIVNRLSKTKKEVEVDHEANLIQRQKDESRIKKAQAKEAQNKASEARAAWLKDKEERSYDRLFTAEALEESKAVGSDEEDFFM